MTTLTKQDFWDPLKEKYPKAMKHFGEWVDQYKSEHNWEALFNDGYDGGWTEEQGSIRGTAPKYHQLPIAMQFGIFTEYWFSCIEKLKKQPANLNFFTFSMSYKSAVQRSIDECLFRLEDKL